MDEELDDVKHMNQMILYSKVVTIRDKQLQENKQLEHEWIEEQKKLDLLMEIANSIGTIPGTTICGLADGAAWPIKTAINKFRGEFEEYIKSGRRSESLALAGAH